MRFSNRPAARRRGFTLIELLVVIGIIAVLIGLAAGAYFRVAQSQNQKRTETTIKKVAVGLNAQWNAVIDDVKNEIKNGNYYPGWTAAQVTSFLAIAGNDRDRANALYMKMRLLQEFPQSFAEAQNPTPGLGLAAKQFYVQAFSGISYTSTSPTAAQQSAICLYLALMQGRRGASFNADDIGGGSVQVLNFTTTVAAKTPQGNVSFSIFVDSWGNPICFEGWPLATVLPGNILAELSAPPYTAAATGNRDPQDPNSKLYLWSSAATSAVFPPFDGQNRSPVVYSYGPDSAVNTFDDIMSFRLLQEGRAGN